MAPLLLQDVVPVTAGLRPMFRSVCAPGAAEETAALCRELGLSSRAYPEGGGSLILLAGPDAARLERFEELDRLKTARAREADDGTLGRLAREMGELLGYPACCTAAYDENATAGAPLAALARSGPGPHRFELNFLYNFQSRGYGTGDSVRELWKRGYSANDAFLVPWVPCRLDCAPSLAYGGKVFAALTRAAPDYAAGLARLLSAAVVYYSDWALIPLLGARRARGGGWAYDEAADLRTLAPDEALRALAAGTRLEKGRGGWGAAGPRGRRDLPAPAAIFEFFG